MLLTLAELEGVAKSGLALVEVTLTATSVTQTAPLLPRAFTWMVCSPAPTDTSVCNVVRSEEHTSELKSLRHLVCRLLIEKKKEWLAFHDTVFAMLATNKTGYSDAKESISSSGGEICIVVSGGCSMYFVTIFFFNDTATTEIYTLSLHDALPI